MNKSEGSRSTPPNDELLKALRAPNSPYKKVGVLREFHNAAAEVIAQLQEQARIWEQRCHEEEKNAAQHYADLMALRTRSESGSSVAPEPVAWRTRRTDALGEPFGPWLYVTSEPTHDPEAPVEPLFTVALSAREASDG